MKFLTYLCAPTSNDQALSMLTSNGHVLEITYQVPTEALSEGWLRVDTWQSCLDNVNSHEALPTPTIFEIYGEGDGDGVVFSEVLEEDDEEVGQQKISKVAGACQGEKCSRNSQGVRTIGEESAVRLADF